MLKKIFILILLIFGCNIIFAAPPIVDSTLLEDDDTIPANELDLNVGTTKLINCSGTVSDADGSAEIDTVFAVLYDTETSSPDAADNNSNHYTNSSCDTSAIDAYRLSYNCLFNVQFYTNPGLWACNVTVNDSSSNKGTKEDNSTITELTAIDVEESNMDFSSLKLGENTGTNDQTKVITNIGNVAFDLSLEVYGSTYADGLAMVCFTESINASYERWSLTSNTDYTLKNGCVSNGIGTDITNFDLSKGASSTKNIHFGLGIPLTPIVKGSCSGTVTFTAISDS